MSDGPAPDPFAKPPAMRAFSAGQRRAAIGLLALFILCIAIGLLRNRATITDPMPEVGPLSDTLADRLDPNDADAASLAALPGMGQKRANDIVAYRERVRRGDASRVVFATLDDLMRVKGVGYAITRGAEPYLRFPTTQATR